MGDERRRRGKTATRRFLAAAFGDAPVGLRFLLWTLPDRQSHWYTPGREGLVDAARDAAGWDGDVYVGVGLSARDRGPSRRCPADEIAAIVGLWADIDAACDEHAKANLPPNLDAAAELLAALGPEPSLTVASGHGLQAWWLFAEPWTFDNDDERTEASRLATRWNLTQRVRAAERGWTVDATQDLARVLRLPGTTNRKGAPVPVRLTAEADVRYQPSDFDAWLAGDDALGLAGGRRTYAPGALDLRANAQPDVDKLDVLRENDRKFRQSWERERRDLPDQSPSAYDMSLATIAADAGWSDQEIADLIVASRRKHGDDLKLRPDYYARTIARARDDRAREQATDEIAATADRVARAALIKDATAEHHARRRLVDQLSDVLGIEIVRLIKYTSDPPRYRLETTVGSVVIGGAAVILAQQQMRAAVAGATNIVIPRFKTPKWDALAQSIFEACEREDVGVEATDTGLGSSWLVDYLADRTLVASPDEALATSHPYLDGDRAYVFGPRLRQWLWTSRGDRVSPSRMGEVLRSIGASHEVINVVVDGKRTTRSVWRLSTELSEQVAGKDPP